MIILLQDSREQAPLDFGPDVQVEVAGLAVGDYGIKRFSDWTNPAFICERKSISDLVGSLTAGRERFMREIEKMRQFGFRALLIEGRREDVELKRYVSAATPQAILASLDAIAVRAGVHVFWCGDPAGAARQFLSLARQFVRGVIKSYERLEKGGAGATVAARKGTKA